MPSTQTIAPAMAPDNPFTQLLGATKSPAPGGIVRGVVWNPEFSGLIDYDAAAEAAVCDLKESDNYTDPAWIQAFGSLADNPEVIIYARGVEIIIAEQATLEHADPEDVFGALESMFFELQGQKETGSFKWRIKNGVHFYARPAGLIDSDQATETRAYQYPVTGRYLFEDGPKLVHLERDRVARIAATATGLGSLLGANANCRVRIHGCAVLEDFAGAMDTYTWWRNGGGCEDNKALGRILVAREEERQAAVEWAAVQPMR